MATDRVAPADAELISWIREVAAGQDPRVVGSTPVVPLRTHGLPTRPFAPEHPQVFICAGVVVKIHRRRTDPDVLRARLEAVRGPDTERVWVQPLGYRPIGAPGGRVATLWPRVTVLSTIDRPPWQEAAALLARLHRAARQGSPPPHGGLDRLHRAVDQVRSGGLGDLTWLATLGDDLARQLARPDSTTWVHGDFHLGQLGHTLLRRSWKLLDVDDFGTGDPVWDLARPAAFRAAGLLDDQSWTTFLEAYRAAEGPAVPAEGDPWPVLDVPARAAALVAAVQVLRLPRTPEGEAIATALLAACRHGHS